MAYRLLLCFPLAPLATYCSVGVAGGSVGLWLEALGFPSGFLFIPLYYYYSYYFAIVKGFFKEKVLFLNFSFNLLIILAFSGKEKS